MLLKTSSCRSATVIFDWVDRAGIHLTLKLHSYVTQQLLHKQYRYEDLKEFYQHLPLTHWQSYPLTTLIYFSRVFLSTTDASRSWHETFIQCVQPSPKSISLTEQEIISVNQPQKHPSSSPIPSPTPIAKAKCCRWDISRNGITTQLFPFRNHQLLLIVYILA